MCCQGLRVAVCSSQKSEGRAPGCQFALKSRRFQQAREQRCSCSLQGHQALHAYKGTCPPWCMNPAHTLGFDLNLILQCNRFDAFMESGVAFVFEHAVLALPARSCAVRNLDPRKSVCWVVRKIVCNPQFHLDNLPTKLSRLRLGLKSERFILRFLRIIGGSIAQHSLQQHENLHEMYSRHRCVENIPVCRSQWTYRAR